MALLPAEEIVFCVPFETADEHMTPGTVGLAGCIVFWWEALAADRPGCLQAIRTEVERLGRMRPFPTSHTRL